MKNLLLYSLCLLLFNSWASAQLVTNIAIRVTVDVINTGIITNSSQATLNLDSGTGKDLYAIRGFNDAWARNKQANGTNATTFVVFCRQEIKDRAVVPLARENQSTEQQASAIQLLPQIISVRWDDLTQTQRNQLAAIAAAFPNP